MLGHDLAAALPGLRAHAESRMGAENNGSTATLWREDPDNPVVVDGLETPGWEALILDLPGRIAASRGAGASRTVTVGQTEMQLAVREWHCASGTPYLSDGDILEIIAGESVGLFLRVVESTGNDQATARRVPVVEIQKPEGL